MDYKEFVPDFEAVGKTDWSKPEVDTNDTMSLLTLGGAALMLIFVFLRLVRAVGVIVIIVVILFHNYLL